jgi:HAMP domain-containing protein
MLLRISLVFAILAGLGALAISHLRVAQTIEAIKQERDDNANARAQAEANEAKAKQDATKAKEAADKATRDLTELRTEHDEVAARAEEQTRRANGLQTDLTKALQERNEARQELNRWTIIGIPPDQILKRLAEIDDVKKEKEALVAENTVILRNLRIAQEELDIFKGKKREVELPAGLKGKVLAVDPKWDFVVLDIGANQGVRQNGKMMVNRGGKLVAKVQIVRVEPDRSIANVLADWKQADVVEGDQVLY